MTVSQSQELDIRFHFVLLDPEWSCMRSQSLWGDSLMQLMCKDTQFVAKVFCNGCEILFINYYL